MRSHQGLYDQWLRSNLQVAQADNDSDIDSNSSVDHSESELLRTIDLFADAVVWSADKKNAFAQLRYDTKASTHLAEIAKNAPSTWAAWRENVTAQRIDGQTQGTSSGTADPMKGRPDAKPLTIAGLTAVDTDDAEDLLLCGTEITGGCQSVDGNFALNRALMGYVVDGKYRMLAAKSDDGRLAARRMLRLLCDENGLPALFLERLYANAGVQSGDPVDEALIDLAKKKADAMGCRLLSDGLSLAVDETQRCTVSSLDSRAPFEFVDAHGLGVQERSYQLGAWPVE